MQGDGRRYRVLEAIGRGGFGTVYKAALLGPGGFRKTVALKVLNPEIAEKDDLAARLRDEARMLGLLRHRALVQVDGLQRLGDRWAVVMEYVEGVDLKRLLGGVGRLPVGVALEIVEEVASALHSAYASPGEDGGALHLLHRDVKPSNVRLTAAGEVKVLDFGVARAEFADRESHTRSVFFGSLLYMAPERLDGIDTHRGDVYACGALLYELLVGEPLGRTSGNRERHDARMAEAMEKFWAVLPDEAVYRSVAACLCYDEAERPDAKGLARHLRALRAARPGPFLRDWAEQNVPRFPEERAASQSDDLSGTILVEDGVALSGSLPAPGARGGRGRGLVLGLVAALLCFGGVVGLGGLGIGALVAREEARLADVELPGGSVVVVASPPEAPAEAAVEPAVAPGPEPDPGSEPDAESEPGPDAGEDPAAALARDAAAADILAEPSPEPVVAEPAPAPAPARATPPRVAAPAPARAAPAPEPEPEPEVASAAAPVAAGPEANARVLLASGARRIKLIGAAGEFGPGPVPAGTYAVDADFGTGEWRRAGNIRVRDGQVGRLVCRENLGRCTLR